MRITAANIPAPAVKTNTSPAVNRATPRHQATDARDSYKRNLSQAQVIDAEYVEFYAPSIGLFDKELQILDSTLEPEIDADEVSDSRSSPALAKYQLKAHEAPPPGSYIDTFA